MSLLLEPFAYGYMTNAMWVSALVGGVCGFLSAFLVLKGWSLIGDALSHSVVPGVAGAYMLGLPFALGAFLSGGLAAGAMLLLTDRSGLKPDVVIGLIFTSFFGLGLFMVSVSPVSIDVTAITMGNILAISPGDTLQLAIIGFVALALLTARWKDLMVTFFDETHARTIGLPTGRLKAMFFILLSAAIVAAMQTVGAFLVVAMVVTPGATAYLLCDRFPRLILTAVAIGAGTSLVGAYASFFLDGATGGVIVTLQTAIFLAVFLLAPKHGLLAARARAAAALRAGPAPRADADPAMERRDGDAASAVPVRLHAERLSGRGAGRGAGGAAVVLSGAQGLGADGRCDQPCRPAGIVLAHVLGLPLILGAFAAGMFTAVATGFLRATAGSSRTR